MTREELTKLTEIRDGLKSAFWDFDKWRWAAKFDQFLADAEHALTEESSLAIAERIAQDEDNGR